MLKENINIDWSYTDRVVRQLVDETEIDFKNSRVRLEAAEYSFPFYSFGARRAYPENLISEPKSNFGKYVISNYGVDETEYKEIYAMYMGIIASRLQDHDENVNHLRLHESPYTPKYYSPKWGVRRENDMLDRIVDGLVEESRIEYVEEIVHLGNFSFQLFKGPFADLYSIPETSPFYQHCMDVYGLTPEEITYVWTEYRNIIRKEMQSNPLSNLISPFNESINESTEDNFLDTIVSQLVDETEIDYEDGMPHISAFPDPGFYIDSSFNLTLDLWENLFGRMFKSFWSHCRNVYGLTDPEIQKVWWEYKKEALKKIDFNRWIIKESTEDNFLDKIVEQLLDETEVLNNRGQLRANAPFMVKEWEDMENEGLVTGIVGGISLAELIDSTDTTIIFGEFKYYCKEMYGLTFDECYEVWEKYRSELYDTDFSHLYTPNIHLDESVEESFRSTYPPEIVVVLDKIVSQLVDETIIKDDEYGTPIAYPSWITDDGYGDIEVPIDVLLDSDKNSMNFTEFNYYVNNMYGLDEDEIEYVWYQYKSGVWDKEQNRINDYHRSLEDEDLNESENKKEKHLDRVLDHLVSGTTIKKEIDRDPLIKVPYLPGNYRDSDDSGYYLSSHIFHSASSHYSFIDYGKEVYGLTEDEINYIAKKYIEILRYKIKHQPYKLDESKDNINTFTDDKDFPFLNKLANHAMRETEISRNAVRFPFIDGYISNNNFHRYFDGASYDQLHFQATLEMDGYLKQFGLTENEKEIWWDIYVVKVRDAVDERDLRIIDGYGELNESPGDTVLDRIAHSMYKESISTPDSFPFDSTSMSFDDYVKNMYGISDEEADYVYREFRYLKGWSELDPYLPDPLNESKGETQAEYLDWVYNTTVDTLRSPEPRGYNLIISLNGYLNSVATGNYSDTPPLSIKKLWDSFGLNLDEMMYLWERLKDEWGYTLDGSGNLKKGLNEQTFVNDIDDPIYEKIADSLAKESEIVVSPAPHNKMFLRSPAWEQAVHIEVALDIMGAEKRSLPALFVKHLKEIYNIKYPTFVQQVWKLYKEKMFKQIEEAQEKLNVPNKQQRFFSHIVKTLVDETEVQTMKDWLPDDETYEQKVWVTPPFLNHAYFDIGNDPHREESVDWNEFSYFGYGYPRYMKDIYGLTDKEGLKLWAIYYKTLQKKVEELIERDRIIYGDD